VHFSIDGYDNPSNNLYRVNSNYDSIIAGVMTLRAASPCTVVWAAIAFRFNEDYLDRMQTQAKSLGVDRFQLTRSTKFGSVYPGYGVDDPLQPSVKFVSTSHRFERDIIDFTVKPTKIPDINIKLYNDVTIQNNVKPLCEIGNKGLYIDARGRLFPCCWVANRYNHNNEWQTLAEQFNLNHTTLEQALVHEFWTGEFQTFRWQECQTKCSSHVVTEKYATEW
jgi:MoaA/NifB/PqqE/SkfB family radical SAM enzyme